MFQMFLSATSIAAAALCGNICGVRPDSSLNSPELDEFFRSLSKQFPASTLIENSPPPLPAGAGPGVSMAPGRVAAECSGGVDGPPSGAPGASSAPSVSPPPSAHKTQVKL